MAEIKKKYECALVLSHDLLGGKWKLRILWHIIQGDNRFSILKKTMPDVSEQVLVEQLKQLEKDGLLKKEIVDNQPPKVIYYRLEEKYSSLIPVIEAICNFSRYYANTKGITMEENS